MTEPLPAAIAGERIEWRTPQGLLSCYASGAGAPLLLVHSINAAACAAEVWPLEERYRGSRTVYCLELPGFGFSERSDREYTPRLMTDAITYAAAHIRTRHPGAPLDALALSLSCEFLARAAAEAPQHFRSLALVSPTGFRGRRPLRAPPGSTRAMPWLYRLLRGPGWSDALYRTLTRPAVIRYFLRRTFGSRAIDERLWAYDVLTARQPGARFAPLYFLSGHLFSTDIHDVYERLSMPVWMSHGVRGDFTDYRNQVLVEGRPNWRFNVYDSGALPYFEVLDKFVADYDAFLEQP